MTKKEMVKHYAPLALLTIFATTVVLLGVVSAANAQEYDGDIYQDQGHVIVGPEDEEEKIFQPLKPDHPYRVIMRDSLRPTRIGGAGELAEPRFLTPDPVPKIADMYSLSDSADNDSRARLEGDISNMAEENPAPNPDFAELRLNNRHIATAQVQVHLKEGQDEKEPLLSWRMNPVEYPIFIKKVAALDFALDGNVPAPDADTAYSHTTVSLMDKQGQVYAPVRILHNRIKLPGVHTPYQDKKRDFETWVLGTAKRHDQREIISEVIHVMSYTQCKALGHTLVDAVPRQCILPDGTIFIEIDEKITAGDRNITSFEKCLKASHPIVNTFPRKCVAPGGRVYVEPPQL